MLEYDRIEDSEGIDVKQLEVIHRENVVYVISFILLIKMLIIKVFIVMGATILV